MPRTRGDGARARLAVAPEVARRRLRARLLMWGAALVTVASLFTLVAFHVLAAQSAFSLERLSKEKANEQLRYERLREEYARLSSASAVIAAAQRLGMVQGPGVVSLPVASTQISVTPSASPAAASTGASYQQTKRALGSTP